MEGVKLTKLRLFWQNLNPLSWPKPIAKGFFIAIFAILLPIYFFIGFQPVSSFDVSTFPTLTLSDLNLKTYVQPLDLTENNELIAPATIAGSYSIHINKTLIIGHSSTVFSSLQDVQLNQVITYGNRDYRITKIDTLLKSDVNMSSILASANTPTIIIMTCAGEMLPNQDATHRLIVTAVAT